MVEVARQPDALERPERLDLDREALRAHLGLHPAPAFDRRALHAHLGPAARNA
jgi:hypothetical protein